MRIIKNKTKIPIRTRQKKSTKSTDDAPPHKIEHAAIAEFFSLKENSGLTIKNLALLLGTTQRTIQNKKNTGVHFDMVQTERLKKLILLFETGIEVFGNSEQFNQWLQKPAYGLYGSIPFDLLMHPGGLDKVLNEVSAIKFGDTV